MAPTPQISDGLTADSLNPPLGTICTGCATTFALPQQRCAVCGGSLRDIVLPETGEVWSVTTVHLAVAGLSPPYGLAYVDLDDGPRVLAAVAPETQVRIGDAVHVASTDSGLVATPVTDTDRNQT